MQAMTPVDAAAAAQQMAQGFEVLDGGAPVWDPLMELCGGFAFGGRQVHDANIVATMLVHGETRLLTFNSADFRRFATLIEVLTP